MKYINKLDKLPKEFESLKLKEIYYKGNLSLLEKKKVSIVGSRKPNSYAKQMTSILSSKLASCGVCVVSGGAIGVDALAHKGAGSSNTIMVAATGLDKRYPAINKNLIADIEENGLVISQFKAKTPSRKYNFPLRNELVVALGDILIVTYADTNSGTMRSVEYALKMKKDIYVLPHRLGESDATNKLLKESKAKAIYDIDEFIGLFCVRQEEEFDEVLDYCRKNPMYEEAIKRYKDKIFEYELLGKITLIDGRLHVR
jgi:DNA processing protein